MKGGYLIGLDNGGSEIKCAVFDLAGGELSVSSRRLPLLTPKEGWTERDAGAVWSANAEAIAEALESAQIDPSDVVGLGLTGYGNGLCLVDGRGEPTRNAIVSTDGRAGATVARLREGGAERRIFPKTLQSIWAAQPAALLPWLVENEPEVLVRSRWVLGIKDYIRLKLTGEFATEVTEASSGCLFDLGERRFDPDIFRELGIEGLAGLMPPCVESAAVSGEISAAAARETGLAEGTPVAGGLFDIDAAALASGVLDGGPLCLIAGTWSINEYLTRTANRDYDRNANTTTLSYLPGYYLVEDSSPTSASNFDWYVDRLMRPSSPGLPRAELYRACDASLPSAPPSESDPFFVPYLFGSAGDRDEKGAFLNLSNRHGRDDLLRAVYEGVAFSTCFHVRRLNRPASAHPLGRLSGGVSRSEPWSQMMADALGAPIEVLEGTQQGAQGAAMAAGVACGAFRDLGEAVANMVRVRRRFEPRPEFSDAYSRRYARYERALLALGLFHSDGGGAP
jgi:L-xylulokinase